MTNYEDVSLATRVERYEAAMGQVVAAHQDVKGVLLEQILFERWQQIGAELGYVPAGQEPDAGQTHQDLAALNHQIPDRQQSPDQHQIPELSESWAG